jgi:hypothetical protein
VLIETLRRIGPETPVNVDVAVQVHNLTLKGGVCAETHRMPAPELRC